MSLYKHKSLTIGSNQLSFFFNKTEYQYLKEKMTSIPHEIWAQIMSFLEDPISIYFWSRTNRFNSKSVSMMYFAPRGPFKTYYPILTQNRDYSYGSNLSKIGCKYITRQDLCNSPFIRKWPRHYKDKFKYFVDKKYDFAYTDNRYFKTVNNKSYFLYLLKYRSLEEINTVIKEAQLNTEGSYKILCLVVLAILENRVLKADLIDSNDFSYKSITSLIQKSVLLRITPEYNLIFSVMGIINKTMSFDTIKILGLIGRNFRVNLLPNMSTRYFGFLYKEFYPKEGDKIYIMPIKYDKYNIHNSKSNKNNYLNNIKYFIHHGFKIKLSMAHFTSLCNMASFGSVWPNGCLANKIQRG